MTTRILIVDDNDDVLHMVAILIMMHYPHIVVSMARDGKEALVTASKGIPPTNVITDIALSQLDGNQLCRALRDDYGDIVKIIAMTGNPASIDAAFDAFVPKPFQQESLLATIDAMLEGEDNGTSH